jgi:protein SCO1/2
MTKNIKTKITVAGVVIAVVMAGLIYSPQLLPPTVSPVIKVPHADLLDQNAVPVKFAEDVVGDKIIAINFIYTQCGTACPIVSAIFEKLQTQLGEKLKQDVRMVSLSINPVSDTPEKLKAYAAHFHAQPEWLWLTGEKTQVDALLKELGVYDADYRNHAPVILIGNPTRSAWTRFNGFTSHETLAAKIDELLKARHEQR